MGRFHFFTGQNVAFQPPSQLKINNTAKQLPRLKEFGLIQTFSPIIHLCHGLQ